MWDEYVTTTSTSTSPVWTCVAPRWDDLITLSDNHRIYTTNAYTIDSDRYTWTVEEDNEFLLKEAYAMKRKKEKELKEQAEMEDELAKLLEVS